MLIRRSTRVVGGFVGLSGADIFAPSQYTDLTIYSLVGHAGGQTT